MTQSQFTIKAKDTYHKCPIHLFKKLDFNKLAHQNFTYIPQEVALDNLKLGININQAGYNIFIMGKDGVNKKNIIQEYLNNSAKKLKAPSDWIYVHNFCTPEEPIAIALPAGESIYLKEAIQKFSEDLKIILPSTFTNEHYVAKINQIKSTFDKKQQKKLEAIAEQAQKQYIGISNNENGFSIFPLNKQHTPLSPEEFEKLTYDEKTKLTNNIQTIQTKLNTLVSIIPNIEKEKQKKILEYNKKVLTKTLRPMLSTIKKRFSYSQPINDYLVQLQEHLVTQQQNSYLAKTNSNYEKEDIMQLQMLEKQETNFLNINIIVDNTEYKNKTVGAPIVYIENPNFTTLFGKIEYISKLSMIYTDFTNIKGGALHQANGGYLILNVQKLLTTPMLWQSLKEILMEQKIKILTPEQILYNSSINTLSPQEIPLNLKVILIGDPNIYYTLWEYDPDFKKLFKVVSEFKDYVEYNDDNVIKYAYYFHYCVKKYNLLPISDEAIGKIIEIASFIADSQNKISTNTDRLKNILYEANYFATIEKSATIETKHIQHAHYQQKNRLFNYNNYVNNYIKNKTLLIETQGSSIGQINGLSVFALNDFLFGQVQRITCVVYKGKNNVINIDKAANLSGSLHQKGTMIAQSFLNARFSPQDNICFSATLSFEQSYAHIDGDSATTTELYSLLSALSGVPLKQGIACTGSMDQKGNVQAIGGVNHKIEGFFNVCQIHGLTGDQGVIIPKSNIKDLMLPDEIVEAIDNKQFHIYAIEHVDEGIEILTDKSAGNIDNNHEYPIDTINYLIKQRWCNCKIITEAQKNNDIK